MSGENQEEIPHCSNYESKSGRLNWFESSMRCLTVTGVAVAAAYASTHSDEKAIGITAWVAVAVVGASTMISGAKNSH